MADAKISALPAMSALAGTEVLTGVQSAINANATPAQIATYIQGLGRTFAAGAGLWYPLGSSGVAASHTGDTNETTLGSVLLPAGAMGANGAVRLWSLWSFTNSGNIKTLRAKIGSTGYLACVQTTQAIMESLRFVRNRNSAASQVCYQENDGRSLFQTTAAIRTGTEDTATNKTIAFTGQLANTGETITLEAWMAEVYYKA